VKVSTPTPVKKEASLDHSFSPGVEMEAISDDDMPEVDNQLIARNVGNIEDEDETNDDSIFLDKKTESLPGQDEETEHAAEPPHPSTDTLVTAEEEVIKDEEGVVPVEAEELDELEEILSDEDLMFEDYAADMNNMDLSEFGDLEIGKPFNPYGVELAPLQSLTDPSSTLYVQATRSNRAEELDEAAAQLGRALELTTRGEKWMDSMGQLSTSAFLPNAIARLHSTHSPEELASVEEKIVDWLLDGLDFELARQQVGPSTHTVRHIKCGLKLALVISQCSQSVLERSVDRGVLIKIVHLYDAPHMALSLKLMCLRSLDSLLSWPYAMDLWMKEPVLDSSNGYAHLVKLMEGPQPSRARVSLAALIQKIHVYEALDRIQDIGQIVARLPPSSAFHRKELRRPSSSSLMVESQDSNSEDSFFFSSTPNHPLEPHLAQLLNSLNLVRRVYLDPWLTIGHLNLFLPVQRQYSISGTSMDPLQSVYRFMRHHRFLQVLLLLSTHPVTSGHPVVIDPVLDFLEEFSKTHHGLCFLTTEPDVTSLILRSLMHSTAASGGGAVDTVQSRVHDDEYSNMEELNATHHHTSTTPHRVGVQLAHSLHVIQCLDALSHLLRQPDVNNKDSLACTEILQSLHSLVFSVTGRLALVQVLALDSYLDILLSFISPEADGEAETKMKESAVRGYAAELVNLVFRWTENASFYAKYGSVLHRLVTSASEAVKAAGATAVGEEETIETGSGVNKLNQLVRWVKTLDQPQIFALDTGLPLLCDLVKQHADDAANFPPELLVALRIICPFVIPDNEVN